MKKHLILIAVFGLLHFSSLANSAECDSNFTKSGSFFSGQTYKTWAHFKNVNPSKAFKNAYLYTMKDGWQIVSSDKELGVISAAQDVSFGKGKTVPLNITVEEFGNSGSKVSMTYSTSGGVSSPTEAVKEHFCLTLAEVSK